MCIWFLFYKHPSYSMPFSKSLHLPISDTVVPIESLLTNIAVSASWLSSIVATTPSIPISACYSLELDSAIMSYPGVQISLTKVQ